MSGYSIVGGRDLELLLLEQGRQVLRRSRVRLAAGLAVFPAAVACSMLLAWFGGSNWGELLFARWLLTMLAWVLLIGGSLWWTVGDGCVGATLATDPLRADDRRGGRFHSGDLHRHIAGPHGGVRGCAAVDVGGGVRDGALAV
ncbi:hypothetical protein Daura_30380 [Dactylosporangium aurantiacum]|uniref:Uncharacterized protein n=1 Tax=Dactylosporangium aurantiacum TaxID=35754 RepID=A0A9Q9MCL9_9ACTN|nr:hypothetical protein [Dactylosporangium aurantiacum]MDG6108705.1 hypothetical protein [Dactylosporangium aurantiacum]UWZ51069.1 hypothetical protein Daura_30380 [Dactylosporangium aurantiacum]